MRKKHSERKRHRKPNNFISVENPRRPHICRSRQFPAISASTNLFTTVTGYVRVPLKVPAKKQENKKSKKSRVSGRNAPSELNEPRWSVVSFEARAAGNLIYAQATEKLAELAALKVSGLCIITDEAAARIDEK